MTLWSDMDYEMHPLPLDADTADRLLAGAVLPEDAPPGYADVARLLDAAAAEPAADELVREAEVVALVAAVVRSSSASDSSSPRRSVMPFALSRPRIAAALVAAAFACTASLASAGGLPGAAQDVASNMLAKLGITVPGPNEHAGTHPNVRGKSTDKPTSAGQGSEISNLARTTELEGVEKGAAISTAASDGKSQAGQHGAASTAPNRGGTGTADAASGGKSAKGTAIANAASDGRSAAGSGNAASGQETAAEASDGHSSAGSDNSSFGQTHRP